MSIKNRLNQIKALAASAKAKALAANGIIAGSLVAQSAMAQTTFDVSSVTDVFTAVGVALGTLGAAYLAMRFGGKAWKWIANLAA